MKGLIIRIVIKDIIDFMVIFFSAALFTLGVYYASVSFVRVPLSLMFFEQILELFFVNHKLIVWALGLGFGCCVLYFLLCMMLFSNTMGGKIARLHLIDKKTKKSPNLFQAIAMAIGAFLGVMVCLLGPLYAWWLDDEHRGWSEKLSRTTWRL